MPCYPFLEMGSKLGLKHASNEKKNSHFQSCSTVIELKTSQLPRKSQTHPATGACKKCVLVKKHCGKANDILNDISKFNRD